MDEAEELVHNAPPIHARNKFKHIVYGDPGAGKTVLLGTIINVPELMPAILWDFEGNTDSIESKCRYLDSWDDLGNPIEGKIDVLRLRTIKEFEQSINYMGKESCPYVSGIYDSMSEIDWLSLRQATKRTDVKRTDPDVPSQQDFGKHYVVMGNAFYNLRDLDKHIFCTCHLYFDDKDDMIRPKLNGQIRQMAPGIFKQTGCLVVQNDRRILYYQPYGRYFAKDITEDGKMGKKVEEPTMQKLYDLRYA